MAWRRRAKSKESCAARPDVRLVVAVRRRQDDAVAAVAQSRSQDRAVGVGDDAAEAARRNRRTRLSLHRSRPFRCHGEEERIAGMGRSVRPLLRHAAPAGDQGLGRRPRRSVRHRLAGHAAASRKSARRSGERVHPAADGEGTGAASQDPGAGHQGRHRRAHGQGRRRDEPLAGIRLRHRQSATRTRLLPKRARSSPPNGSSASARSVFPISCARCRQNCKPMP